MNKVKITFLVCQMIFIQAGWTQAINEFAASSYFRQANAQEFMGPLIDVFGSSIHAASLSMVCLDTNRSFFIGIGLNVSAAFIPDNMKSFDGHTTEPFSPELTMNAPTIFGDDNTTILYDERGNAFTFPGGFKISRISLAFPEIHVGTFYHTNFSGRFLALNLGGDLDRIELYGIGFNHFISDYWEAKDYFITFGASFNQIKLGNYSRGRHFMAQVSGGQHIKKFDYWVFSQLQHAPYEFYYEEETGETGTVEIDGLSNFRMGAGCSLRLGMFTMQLETSGFKPYLASFGIGLQF